MSCNCVFMLVTRDWMICITNIHQYWGIHCLICANMKTSFYTTQKNDALGNFQYPGCSSICIFWDMRSLFSVPSPGFAALPVCACVRAGPCWERPSSSWTYPLFHSPPCCRPPGSAAHPLQSWELKAAERRRNNIFHIFWQGQKSSILQHYTVFPAELMLYQDHWFNLWTTDIWWRCDRYKLRGL